jgi:hypothetical protein
MKKTLALLIVAATFSATIISCGPSAEEKAAAEKARQDSINAAMEKMTADSLAMVETARQDSMRMVAEKATADSIAAAEANKKPAPRPKTKEEKKTEEAKKVTGGRG